jgi:hypothetical protein
MRGDVAAAEERMRRHMDLVEQRSEADLAISLAGGKAAAPDVAPILSGGPP